MYVQPLEGQFGPTLAPLETAADSALSPAQSVLSQTFGAEDGISRFVPPWIENGMTQNPMQTAMFGPLSGLLQQLMQMLQSMTGSQGYGYGGYGGYGGCSGYGGCGGNGYGNEQYFANASGSSTGDPHLSFNGSHWDSMSSQPDLLESNSIPGGYQISTQVTGPNSRGVTWNQSATIALDGGETSVSMNDLGEATLSQGNRTIPLSAGQTIQLGNGASVTCSGNGSLSVLAQNGSGGCIQTTLTAQGKGVNVQTSAQNVDLGGSLVAGNPAPPIGGPITAPVPGPIGNPVGGPIYAPVPGPVEPPVFGGPLDPWQPITPAPIGGSPVIAPREPVQHMTPF